MSDTGTTLSFLQAKRKLTKTFTKDGVEPYPLVRKFFSHEEDVSTIDDLFKAIDSHAKKGHALLSGRLSERLEWDSRAGATRNSERKHWVCLDFDGIEDVQDVDDLLFNVMKLPLTTYVRQWSASYHPGDPVKAHVFMMLDSPVKPATLVTAIKAWNLTTPLLADQTTLSAAKVSLSWPLDIAPAYNSQIIYIAPPRFTGKKDPLAGETRIALIRPKGASDTLPASALPPLDEAAVAALQRGKIQELQRAAGVRAHDMRTTPTKLMGETWELVENPQPAEVTSEKVQGPYVRYNVNGGDSWAYWRWKDDTRYVYSYKDRTVYRMREFLPEAYRVAQEQLAAQRAVSDAEAADAFTTAVDSGESVPVVFLRADTEQYVYGDVSRETAGVNDLRVASRLSTAKAWASQVGAPIDKHPDVWDPWFGHDREPFDFERKRFNLFARRDQDAPAHMPKELAELTVHICGGDADMAERLWHWVAAVYQTSEPTHTAWVLSGTQGTGKDLFARVITAAIGDAMCSHITPEQLTERFNGWAENKVFVYIPEIDTENADPRVVQPKLNDYITADELPIRKMRRDVTMAPNRLNFLFASNKVNSLRVTQEDRRYHVPPRQEKPLRAVWGQDKIDKVVAMRNDKELLAGLRAWLYAREVDWSAVRVPVVSEAKKALQAAGSTSIDHISDDVVTGNISRVLDDLPAPTDLMTFAPKVAARVYDLHDRLQKLAAAATAAAATDGTMVVNVRDFQVLMALCMTPDVLDMPVRKFEQFLLHRGVLRGKVRLEGDTLSLPVTTAPMAPQWRQNETAVVKPH